jgi:hypothetical protein
MRSSTATSGLPRAAAPRRAPAAAAASARAATAAASPLASGAPSAWLASASPRPHGRGDLHVASAKARAERRGGRRGRGGGGGTASTTKGFGEPDARLVAEPWEGKLPAYYKAYYRGGFKPPRFIGPIELEKRDGARRDGRLGMLLLLLV